MKIIEDTGYVGRQAGRCYHVSERTVAFDASTSVEEIQAFVDAEKKGWYGQEFSARYLGAKTIHIRKGVDSGD